LYKAIERKANLTVRGLNTLAVRSKRQVRLVPYRFRGFRRHGWWREFLEEGNKA